MEETNYVSLKLLIDTERERVLFAEAGKEFIDFLLSILALPLGTGMVGSFGNIYHSIDNLGTVYLQPNVNKETLLKPKLHISGGGGGSGVPLKSPDFASSAKSRKLYRCSLDYNKYRPFCVACNLHVAYGFSTCPSCRDPMNTELNFVDPPSTKGGYVKEVVTYMVMDDLEVKPMCTTSTFTLLNKFNVKELGVLEEKVVDLGMDEGVKLFKASLQSKSVLTDVFLPKLKQEVKWET
ncbi:uncharacterized protein LOC112000072 [Quercus suber]|uniref:uncharacterized protein LOC112000072 n=1 Tax=Quercus suber TaxID=58331 RepID=UPI000CE2705D|nr:uncharacterized protein LOC112000072 [Quercus suber]POE66820.1 hypothetical protein CFP56_52030 [Quercus suber]